MSYRHNELENVLREEYEVAKATLNEIARKNEHLKFNEDNPKLEYALSTLGFRKEELSRMLSAIEGLAYVRENERGLEILADKNLVQTTNSSSGFHLYLIPTGQDFQEINGDLRIYDLVERERGSLGGFLGFGVGTCVGFAVGLAAGRYVPWTYDSSTIFGIIIWTTTTIGVSFLGGYIGRKCTRNPLKTLATDPDALRYIAQNSKYEPSQLRRVQAADEEFTDKEAKEEHQATLEAIAEEQQQRLRK